MLEDGAIRNGFVVGATKTNVFYLEREADQQPQSVRRSQLKSIYFMEPSEYAEAMALFEDRKYSEAYKRFGEVKQKYKKMELLPDNYSHLAGFYQLECLRKQLDLPALVKEFADFGSPDLSREDQLTQLEAYAFWEAVNNKAWGRVIRTADSWKTKKLPVSIRAQVAYCAGLAHEEQGNAQQALEAYATAMTADYTKSEVIVRNAALNSLRVYQSLPEVKAALEQKDKGNAELRAAGALASLYQQAGFGAGVALPSEYQPLLAYAPSPLTETQQQETAQEEVKAAQEDVKVDPVEEKAKEDPKKGKKSKKKKK